MADWVNQALGTVYKQIPPGVRPHAKQAFVWGMLRSQALAQRRSIGQGRRVEFLDFEIAHLEPFEFLGPGPRDVQVKAAFSTVSPGTERAVLCGMPGARRPFPYVPGYSVAGTVTKPGRASGFSAGQLVAGRMGHASHGLMAPTSLFPVPGGVDLLEASYIEIGIICLQGIRKARIRPGDRVAVLGQGLIGQMATRLARAVGASPIIALAMSRRRAKSAVGIHGADEFVAIGEDPGALARLEADIVIEAVGTSKAIVQAMSAVKRGGTVVLLGSSRDLGRDLDWRAAQERSVRLVGAHISVMPARDASAASWTYAQEGRLFLELLKSGRLRVADLTTWRVPPAQCNQVYEVIAQGGADQVGIVFDWQADQAAAGR